MVIVTLLQVVFFSIAITIISAADKLSIDLSKSKEKVIVVHENVKKDDVPYFTDDVLVDECARKIMKINKNIDVDTAYTIAKNIVECSRKYNIPHNIIFSVIWTESTFNPYAYNKQTGCIGLMQINYRVWFSDTPKYLLFTIPANIEAGCQILKYYYDKYKTWDKALYYYYGQSKYAEKYSKIILKRAKEVKYNEEEI